MLKFGEVALIEILPLSVYMLSFLYNASLNIELPEIFPEPGVKFTSVFNWKFFIVAFQLPPNEIADPFILGFVTLFTVGFKMVPFP